MDFKIAVLGGDGIGPEVTAEGVKVLEAVGRIFGHGFSLETGDVGGISIDKHGTPLLPEVAELAASADAVLFGAVGGPKWDDPAAPIHPEDGLLQEDLLRKVDGFLYEAKRTGRNRVCSS